MSPNLPTSRQLAPASSVRGAAEGLEGGRSHGDQGANYRDWSDLQLVDALSDQCGDAYAELYRRHSRSVGAAAKMILGREDRCDDVIAEIFVRLWFSPERFDPLRGTLLAFLRMSAKGLSIDMVRTETARHRRESNERWMERTKGADVDAALLASESAVAVRDALAMLPPREREALHLAFFSGMTYKEVARELGLPEGTAKSRIRTGLTRLRDSELIDDRKPTRVDLS